MMLHACTDLSADAALDKYMARGIKNGRDACIDLSADAALDKYVARGIKKGRVMSTMTVMCSLNECKRQSMMNGLLLLQLAGVPISAMLDAAHFTKLIAKPYMLSFAGIVVKMGDKEYGSFRFGRKPPPKKNIGA